MAEFKDMYKIVKYVSGLEAEEAIKTSAPDIALAAHNLIDKYEKSRRFGRPNPEHKGHARLVRIIYAASQDKKYLRPAGNAKNGIYFHVTTKGLHLIAKKFFFFRVGLWDESLKDYDALRVAVFGGGLGAFITAVIAVIIKFK